MFAKSAAGDSVGESGLHWLFPLWTYRDVEVFAHHFYRRLFLFLHFLRTEISILPNGLQILLMLEGATGQLGTQQIHFIQIGIIL